MDIDRFIGYPMNSPVHLSHATLLTHSILKAGDPYTSGARSAVLEYRKDLSTATLPGHNRTPLLTLPDEFFFFVQNGEGRLDDGKQSWDLHEGLALLDVIEGLDGYHLLHAARADFYRRLDKRAEAATEYRLALELTQNESETRYLERRLAEVS